WEPAFADIASTADLGYTTGPWELQRTPEEQPTAFGHYVTVWRRQADGAWKIAVDIGISHPRNQKPTAVESPRLRTNTEAVVPNKEQQRARKSLLDAEKKFPRDTKAYLKRLAPDARVYRNESVPLVGRISIERAFANMKNPFTWQVMDANVAGSA